MGRRPCCDKIGLKKGAWTAEEDKKLINFILSSDQCCWRAVPKHAGLLRCGKSCRLRWTNYLRPDLKRGLLSEYEERLIIDLHSQHGNKWSKIASHMPGRTDNEIKNLWHTHIKKKLSKMGIDPVTHKPLPLDPTDDDQSRGEAEQSREEMHEQDEVQEIDGVPLLESTFTNPDEHGLQAKEKIALMDTNNGFSIDEVPIIQPHEILVINSDLPSSLSSSTSFSTSSASSTTISMSTINSILDDLKFSPYFEDWHTDDHSKSYMENMSFPYDDDFTDWDSLLNDIDIDKIGHEIIHSPPDFTTAQE